LKVPEGMQDEEALFVGDILTTAYYGTAIAGIQPEDTVAVIGAGPVGFFALQAAQVHGAERVLVLDMEPERLALAEKFGAVPINAWWERAMQAVQSGAIDPLPIISHRMSLDEAPHGYELFEARQATKVVLKP